MNGVEILSTETIYNTILPEWCVPLGMLLGGVCLVLMIQLFVNDYTWAGVLLSISMIVCIAIGVLGLTDNENNVNHIEYKVTIDDSVSMNEFLDKYEILDQEGKIYTVKEKE